MEILKSSQINEIVLALKKGKILAMPTETSYGLCSDAKNQSAADRIFKIKGRDFNKPLLVVVDSVKIAKKYLVFNSLLSKIANKYWLAQSEALTVVGNYKKNILCKFFDCGNLAKGVVGANNTLAVRVTNDAFLKEICKKLNSPIIATSANLAGENNIYNFEELQNIFLNQEFAPDILVDGGSLKNNLPSTLVSVIGGDFKILRQGNLKVEI